MKKNKKSGSTVLELLFYIALFSVMSLVVINSMITMTKSFKETTIQAELTLSGAVMERLSREIRQANSITSISTSDLVLNTGTNKTIEFLLSGLNLQLIENSVLTGNLNPQNISINNLVFTKVNTLKSQAVKVSFTIKSNDDVLARTYDFYDTIVLRGSY